MSTGARPKVLVVDDDAGVRGFLKLALEPIAAQVTEVTNATQALAAIESGDYDLVISDICMPGASGLELLALGRQSKWDVGFIIMTGQLVVESVIEALRWGAFDFLTKPLSFQDLTESVSRVFQRLQRQREAGNYRQMLEESIERRTRSLEMALRELQSNYQTTLEALVAALDAREHETYAHSFRVRAFTTHLARLVGYPPALLPHLDRAALLHDIGKIAVSDAILLKPGKLTPEEWELMQKHPVAGEQIMSRISFLTASSVIVRHHHERFDGTGYPDHLAGERIPRGARLFAFADTLDAMISDRPYRKALGVASAYEEIRRCNGKQFDPAIAEVFLGVPEQDWESLRQSQGGSPPSHHLGPKAVRDASLVAGNV